MYTLTPPAVFVHERVLADDRYRRRMHRVLDALATPITPQPFCDDDLPEMIRQGLLAARVPMGALAEVRDPVLIFNTFRFDDQQDERMRWAKSLELGVWENSWRALLGYGAFHWANYNQEGDQARHDKVCRPCWRIHLQEGCVHRCSYCPLGGALISMLNIEDYCHHLGGIIERHPWQETYLLDDDADPPCLEPEQGTLGHLIEYFGTLTGRYLVIHTKTWNTDWLRNLKHNGNTILVWSLSGATQSSLIEPRTGTTAQRIDAARVAQDAGYTIRYKFKPIIPVHNWRQDAADAVELLFARTRPDMISLCVFMWMEIEEMLRRVPRALLDAACVQAALDGQEAMTDTSAKPFPPDIRLMIYEHYLQEIRRWAPELPVSLSTENFAMWKEMGPRLGATATSYVCGCGPNSTPGATTLKCHPFTAAIRNDAGLSYTY
jgi:DNA repair photolyase